jgi:plastocyanin
MNARVGASCCALALLGTLVVASVRPVSARVPSGDALVTVHVRDNTFRPARLSVRPGTTVRWVNEGRNRHNITPDSGDEFGSGNLQPGQSYAFQFESAGTFGYYCTLHGTPGKGQAATLRVGDDVAAGDVEPAGAGDGPAPSIRASGRTIRVPRDATSIQAGVDRAKPGDLVLVSPGVYRESVTIATDGVVLRGVDRNRTVLDGDFERANGVKVVGADGVAIENLTARNYTENGFFWNGVKGYRGTYLTAYRNGDYGLFAYDSQWGVFERSYASGAPDAGFYIGQCNPCHALIDQVVAEYNQLGYSGTNAGGDLLIVRSTFNNNRAGIGPNSLESEELAPQGRATIVGNLVATNGTTADAAQGANEIWDVVFGVGIAVVGGSNNEILRNHLPGNAIAGIVIAPNPGLEGNPYPATGNVVRGNNVHGTRLADLATVLLTPDDGNCFADNQYGTSAPVDIEQVMPCAGPSVGDPNAGALDVGQFLDTAGRLAGSNYQASPVPRDQQTMPRARTAAARPAGAPPKVDLDSITRPG